MAGIPDICVGQQEFGELVGLTQSRVSQLMTEGVLAPGATLRSWIVSYCSRLRSQAVERSGDEDGTGLALLTQERAKLARVQREAVEIKVAAMQLEYAPAAVLSEVLTAVSIALARELDQLPQKLRDAHGDLLTSAAWDVIDRVVADARSEWVRGTASLQLPAPDGASDDEAGDD